MIKILSHLAAVVVMTLIVGFALTVLVMACLLAVCFVAWVAPDPNWSGIAQLFRLAVAFGLPVGIWFACEKTGREFAADLENDINKWISKNDHQHPQG